jgi:predicted enzyme related to lactoylglutathione lyase
MRLAKPAIDIGLSTHAVGPMLAFWQREVGARFDHVLTIRRGLVQHRHDLMGSVLKINERDAPVPAAPPSGYAELLIARAGLLSERSLADPEGALVRLVPPGALGVRQIGLRVAARSLAAHRRFYGEALGLPETSCASGAAFRAGDSLILVEERPDATGDGSFEGPGWRYITFQVFDVDLEHAAILAAGGREAMPPTTLGETARISMVKDPDGNWIEISQRASLTGPLGR